MVASNTGEEYAWCMTDFDDELESLEEQLDNQDEEYQDELFSGGLESYDDLESDKWSERFGESYIADPYDAEELDDQELERLEEDFFHDDGVPPSRFGRLDEINDD